MIDPERAGVLVSSLATDGYRMEIAEEGDHVSVTITATPEACADCLVPKDLMRSMLSQALGVPAEAIGLTYPREVSLTMTRRTSPPFRADHVGSLLRPQR